MSSRQYRLSAAWGGLERFPTLFSQRTNAQNGVTLKSWLPWLTTRYRTQSLTAQAVFSEPQIGLMVPEVLSGQRGNWGWKLRRLSNRVLTCREQQNMVYCSESFEFGKSHAIYTYHRHRAFSKPDSSPVLLFESHPANQQNACEILRS